MAARHRARLPACFAAPVVNATVPGAENSARPGMRNVLLSVQSFAACPNGPALPAYGLHALRRLAQRIDISGRLSKALPFQLSAMFQAGEDGRAPGKYAARIKTKHQPGAVSRAGVLRQQQNIRLPPLGRCAK